MVKKRLRVRILCVCCSETKILTLFSPNFARGREVSGVGFSHCTRGPTISLQCTSSTEGRLVKRKESEISFRPRGLANNVEPTAVAARGIAHRASGSQRRGRAVNELQCLPHLVCCTLITNLKFQRGTNI